DAPPQRGRAAQPGQPAAHSGGAVPAPLPGREVHCPHRGRAAYAGGAAAMSGFTGTGRLFRLALRRDRIVASAWILGLFVYAYRQPATISGLYPTQADLDRLARTAEGVGANPAVVALQGPAYDAHTYGGATAWQLVTPWVFLLGLMSLLLVTRHTRQEEETGRAELVSARVGGRFGWLAAALLFVLAVNIVLAALTALAFIALGLPAARCG